LRKCGSPFFGRFKETFLSNRTKKRGTMDALVLLLGVFIALLGVGLAVLGLLAGIIGAAILYFLWQRAVHAAVARRGAQKQSNNVSGMYSGVVSALPTVLKGLAEQKPIQEILAEVATQNPALAGEAVRMGLSQLLGKRIPLPG
jgi:hypothetical protein